MKHEGKEWQNHHPCHGSVQVLIFLENQSCHIHQHFEQMLDSTFTCYISVSFAQHGRTFLHQEEHTWLSLQKSGTVWISHLCNNTKTTKHHQQNTHTTQLKSVLLKSKMHAEQAADWLHFTLFIPLQKRGSPLGQKNL